MEIGLLDDPIRKHILDILNRGICKFNDIRKEIKIDSNKLTYHLKKLSGANFIFVENGIYKLTEECKNFFPYRKIITQKQIPIMPVTAVAIIRDDKVFLQNKPGEPGRGNLILTGGTAPFQLSIEDSAKQKVFEQIGVKISNLKLRAISESLVVNGTKINQHWIVYLFTAKTIEEPKNGKWYSLKKLPKDLFLDNKFFLEKAIYNIKPRNYRIIKNTKETKIEML
jgi:ADP-ribose pyrophosphatase YjhB (NUDIX family)